MTHDQAVAIWNRLLKVPEFEMLALCHGVNNDIDTNHISGSRDERARAASMLARWAQLLVAESWYVVWTDTQIGNSSDHAVVQGVDAAKAIKQKVGGYLSPAYCTAEEAAAAAKAGPSGEVVRGIKSC